MAKFKRCICLSEKADDRFSMLAAYFGTFSEAAERAIELLWERELMPRLPEPAPGIYRSALGFEYVVEKEKVDVSVDPPYPEVQQPMAPVPPPVAIPSLVGDH